MARTPRGSVSSNEYTDPAEAANIELPSQQPAPSADASQASAGPGEVEDEITQALERHAAGAAPTALPQPAEGESLEPEAPVAINLTPPEAAETAVDETALMRELIQSGQDRFTDAMRERLRGEGHSDQFIARMERVLVAEARQMVSATFETIGGVQRFEEIRAWAVQNMTPAQLAAVNQQLNDTSLEVRQLAAETLAARYERSTGAVRRIAGSGGADSGPTNPLPVITSPEVYAQLDRHPLNREMSARGEQFRRYFEERVAEYGRTMGF